MKTAEQIREDLKMFTGTQHYYRSPIAPNIVFTDGVNYLVDELGCDLGWLIGMIALWQMKKKVKEQQYQSYKLKVYKDRKTALLTMTDGNLNIIHKQKFIGFIRDDFPLDEVEIWFMHGVCLLPSEY